MADAERKLRLFVNIGEVETGYDTICRRIFLIYSPAIHLHGRATGVLPRYTLFGRVPYSKKYEEREDRPAWDGPTTRT